MIFIFKIFFFFDKSNKCLCTLFPKAEYSQILFRKYFCFQYINITAFLFHEKYVFRQKWKKIFLWSLVYFRFFVGYFSIKKVQIFSQKKCDIPTWSRGSWFRRPTCRRGGRGRSSARGSTRACRGSASGSPGYTLHVGALPVGHLGIHYM